MMDIRLHIGYQGSTELSISDKSDLLKIFETKLFGLRFHNDPTFSAMGGYVGEFRTKRRFSPRLIHEIATHANNKIKAASPESILSETNWTIMVRDA